MVGVCRKTGKRSYNYAGARWQERALQKKDEAEGRARSAMNIYMCDHCGFYHVGHVTSNAIRLERQRDAKWERIRRDTGRNY